MFLSVFDNDDDCRVEFSLVDVGDACQSNDDEETVQRVAPSVNVKRGTFKMGHTVKNKFTYAETYRLDDAPTLVRSSTTFH